MKSVFDLIIEITRKNLRLQLSTVLILSLNFAIVITLQLFSINFRNSLEKWGKNAEVNVYLKDDITDKQSTALAAELRKNQLVKTVNFQNKESVRLQFKDSLKEIIPDIDSLDEIENPFSNSYNLKLVEQADVSLLPKLLAELSSSLSQLEGVDEVSYGETWFNSFTSLLLGINIGVSTLIFIIALACLMVIANVIRASIEKRREEIEILELVGATQKSIQRPYVVEGSFIGLVSSLIAIAISYFVFKLLVNVFAPYFGVLEISHRLVFLSSLQILVTIFLCSLIGALSSYITTRKINTGWAASDGVDV